MKSTRDAVLYDLAEEFVGRCRVGESVRWEDYAAEHPELAGEIEEFFPLMQFVDGAVSSRLTERGKSSNDTLPDVGRGVVGDYRIVGEVGRGGMGVVYEAEQISLKRRVALKVQKHGHLTQGKAERRFQQEAQAVAQLVHPNIVPVYDVGRDGEFAYYAMQLIEGQPVDEFIADVRGTQPPGETQPGQPPAASHGNLATGEIDSVSASGAPGHGYFRFVARVGAQVADALAFAHGRGIIHRDIKPSNLLLDRELAAWVTDFGLAKVADSKLTQSGDVLGTVRYMAPVQFRGWSDPRSDVYSLGATLYELTSLQPVYETGDRIELIRQIASEEPRPLRKRDPRTPRDLEVIVHKSLRKEPGERYESADELRDDLQQFLRGEPIHARHDSLIYLTRKAMRRYRAAMIAAALVVVVLTIGLVATSLALRRAERAEAQQRSARLDADDKGVQLAEQLHIATVTRLAAQSRSLRDDWPIQSVLLSIEAVEMSRRRGGKVMPSAHEALLNAVSGMARLWDLTAKSPGASSIVLKCHEEVINSIAVSPDCRWLATASSDATVRLWDITANDPAAHPIILQGHADIVSSVAFSSNGRRLVMGSRDNTVRVWNLPAANPQNSPLVLRGPENGKSDKGPEVFAAGILPPTTPRGIGRI